MDKKKVLDKLQEILGMELTAHLNYLSRHYSVVGFENIGLAQHFLNEANESWIHAQAAAKRIVALGGVPDVQVAFRRPAKVQNARTLLKECQTTEKVAAKLYQELLPLVQGDLQLTRLAEDTAMAELASYEELDLFLKKV